MNTTQISVFLSISIALIGCATAKGITPSDVAQYKTPQDVINGKKLNGDSGSGKSYLHHNNAPEGLFPHSYMKNFCISQGGTLYQDRPSDFSYMSKQSAGIEKKYDLQQAIGTFSCKRDNQVIWKVVIEPTASDNNTKWDLQHVTLKTFLIN